MQANKDNRLVFTSRNWQAVGVGGWGGVRVRRRGGGKRGVGGGRGRERRRIEVTDTEAKECFNVDRAAVLHRKLFTCGNRPFS